VDRYVLILSTLCFIAAVARTLAELRERIFRPARFNFQMIAAGFVLQSVFLYVRGHAIGRCPLTNLFEVLIFLAWSIALIYMLVGPGYRLSLMGAFTAPLVVIIQTVALVAPFDTASAAKMRVSPWLEFHASMAMVAYGAFALAGIAGVMYLVQERQLKTHQLHSIFSHLPPLHDLTAVMTRLLWWGFALYTVGLASGFFIDQPWPRAQIIGAICVWVLYAAILHARHLRRLSPKGVATLCIVGFSAALTLLWGITFTAQLHTTP
jgi:HemX protein